MNSICRDDASFEYLVVDGLRSQQRRRRRRRRPARPARRLVGRRAIAVLPHAGKALTLHHEIGNAADGLADPPCLLGGRLAGTDAVTLRIVAAKRLSHRQAAGVLDGVALGILPVLYCAARQPKEE
jgi:hypothetical protein